METNHKKHRWILLRDFLSEQIISGQFKHDQQFPGIQQIADNYHVSYLTASKVLKSLANEGYLRCKNGVGHFVSYVSEETALPHKVVQFIMRESKYQEREACYLNAAELFRNHGWDVRIVKCPMLDISAVSTEINSPDTYSIVCEMHVPWQRFQASLGNIAKRVLILGALAGNSEIMSIISDEYETIRQAMMYFEKKNRRDVAIITGFPMHELEALRLGAWRSAVQKSGHSMEWIREHCFPLTEEHDQAYSWDRVYPRLMNWLKRIRKDCDGLIVPIQHAEIIAACLRCKIKIPKEITVLLIAKMSPEIKLKDEDLPGGKLPDIDLLDHNYAGHFQCALEILEDFYCSEKRATGYWYFCPPGKIQKCKRSIK